MSAKPGNPGWLVRKAPLIWWPSKSTRLPALLVTGYPLWLTLGVPPPSWGAR